MSSAGQWCGLQWSVGLVLKSIEMMNGDWTDHTPLLQRTQCSSQLVLGPNASTLQAEHA